MTVFSKVARPSTTQTKVKRPMQRRGAYGVGRFGVARFGKKNTNQVKEKRKATTQTKEVRT